MKKLIVLLSVLSTFAFGYMPRQAVVIGTVKTFNEKVIVLTNKGGTIKVPRSSGPDKIERDQILRLKLNLTDLTRLN